MRKLALCVIAFFFIAAPIYMEKSHPVFVNGTPFGNALTINGVLAVPLDDFTKVVGGTAHVQGNFLSVSPRDPASGLPTGKRMHKPFVITKELDKATPLLFSAGKHYIALSDFAKLLGLLTFAAPARLQPGQAINLNLSGSPDAAIGLNR